MEKHDDQTILKGIIGKIDHDQSYGVSKKEMLELLRRLLPESGLSEFALAIKSLMINCSESITINITDDNIKAIEEDFRNILRKELGPQGPTSEPGDPPGRRGRQGCVPPFISKMAEAFRAELPEPYDGDDICSAFETGMMTGMSDKPLWRKSIFGGSVPQSLIRRDGLYFVGCQTCAGDEFIPIIDLECFKIIPRYMDQ